MASQIVFAFLIVELFSLLPIFVKNCLNENVITFSLADVTYGFGALIAGLITTKTLKKSNKIDFTILLIMTAGYSFFLMIKFPNLNMFFASTFIIGVVNASIRITRMSYFFDTIPNNLIGRINTIFNSVNTLIRGVLILIFSMTWFAEGSNVIMGYKIGIYILILFTLPLMLMKKQKLN